VRAIRTQDGAASATTGGRFAETLAIVMAGFMPAIGVFGRGENKADA
jgi:hypothetical protein